MKNKYKTPKLDSGNIVSFTCSDYALESILELLNELRTMGSLGCTRDIIIKWGGENDKIICFDGDGGDKINNININGLSEDQWEKEWKRLDDIHKQFNEKLSNPEDDISEKYQ